MTADADYHTNKLYKFQQRPKKIGGPVSIGVARGGKRGHGHPKLLENILNLCFERRFSKQNSIIRLKSNILPPQKILGWLRHCRCRSSYPLVKFLSEALLMKDLTNAAQINFYLFCKCI